MGEKSEVKKDGPKIKGLGFILWIAAALVILILFLANSRKILANLKRTDFFDRTIGSTPAFVENAKLPDTSSNEKNDVQPMGSVEINLIDADNTSSGVVSQNQAALNHSQAVSSIEEDVWDAPDAYETASRPGVQQEVPLDSTIQDNASVEKSVSTGNSSASTAVSQGTPARTSTVPAATMKLKLFFMSINSDGSITRKEVTRAMKKSDSPLSDAVNALINGPDAAEDSQGCRSLVSNGTRLLGASVRNGVATLNFSGEFEFNQYGIEGTRGQLQQIVYTATAFPTVESVQFLVDGERKEYLGSEGVWIGTPLNRNSF